MVLLNAGAMLTSLEVAGTALAFIIGYWKPRGMADMMQKWLVKAAEALVVLKAQDFIAWNGCVQTLPHAHRLHADRRDVETHLQRERLQKLSFKACKPGPREVVKVCDSAQQK